MDDRVHALRRQRTVRRPAGEFDLDDREATQTHRPGQVGRLPHHRHVGRQPGLAQPVDHRLRAETGVLLVGDQCEHDTSAVLAGDLLCGDHQSGHPALHVGSAPPVQPITLDPGFERCRHALDPDGVDVPVEQQRRAGSRPWCQASRLGGPDASPA